MERFKATEARVMGLFLVSLMVLMIINRVIITLVSIRNHFPRNPAGGCESLFCVAFREVIDGRN